MTRTLFFLMTFFGLVSCGSNDPEPAVAPAPEIVNSDSTDMATCALAFINGYVENCNKMNKSTGMVEWVNASGLATEDFKKELEKISKEEELDADPIFDAQDYPDQGYVIDALPGDGYVMLHGKNWPEFKLVMKVVKKGGKWMVDGCGTVNIPPDKRAKR